MQQEYEKRTSERISTAIGFFRENYLGATFVPFGSAFRLARVFGKPALSTFESSDVEFMAVVEKPRTHKVRRETVNGTKITCIEVSWDLFKKDYLGNRSLWVRLLPLSIDLGAISGTRAQEIKNLFLASNKDAVVSALQRFRYENPRAKEVSSGQLADLILRKMLSLNEAVSFKKRTRIGFVRTVSANIEKVLASFSREQLSVSNSRKKYPIPERLKPKKHIFQRTRAMLEFYFGQGALGGRGRLIRVKNEFLHELASRTKNRKRR